MMEWTPTALFSASSSTGIESKRETQSKMNRRTIGVGLAKAVFWMAVSDERGVVCKRHGFNRLQLAQLITQPEPVLVGMEPSGTGHSWGGTFSAMGHHCRLSPTLRVRKKPMTCRELA